MKFADRTLTGLALRQNRLRPRNGPIRGIVIHTTGSGPDRRSAASPERFPTPYEAAMHIYTKITPYCGHFLLDGETGHVTSLVPPETVAWHVSSKGGRSYRWRYWKKPLWWENRWPHLKSPRQFMGGYAWKPSVNRATIGIEIVGPPGRPRGPWSDAAWARLFALTHNLSHFYGFPMNRTTVVTHSDIHPLSRTSRGAPWDPGFAQWFPPVAWSNLQMGPVIRLK